jgi:hypothetical protein
MKQDDDNQFNYPLRINTNKFLMEERRIAILDFAKVKIDNEDDFLIFKIMAERNINVQCLVNSDELQGRKDQISNPFGIIFI